MSEKKTVTPHINAAPEDFGRTVLMPGDPRRSRFIAQTYLEKPVLINDVRGVQGYTGTYKGTKVTVMASGMGMPSMGIYSYELFKFMDVDRIIRLGSAGAMNKKVRLRDIVLGMGACTDSNYAHQFNLPGSFAPIASFSLLRTCEETARELGCKVNIGNLLSTDAFYGDLEGLPDYRIPLNAWEKMGVLAVEMESAALYMNAARTGKEALCICTVSDHLITDEHLSSEEREVSFTEMFQLGLETAVKMEKK